MANSNGWGDGASNNAIGWGQGANNAIAWGDSHAKSWAGSTDIVGLTTDPSASAFISAAGITDATQISAINNLVVGLKSDGLWTKMKAIYPFVGGTASTHKWNLKDPRDLDAAFRLVFNGGWTHSSNGATPNGTNGYADTKFIPTTNFNSLNDKCFGLYVGTNTNNGVEMGALSGAYVGDQIVARNTNLAASSNSNLDPSTSASTDSRGFWLSTRSSSLSGKYYKNSTSIITLGASVSQYNNSMFLGARRLTTSAEVFSDKRFQLALMGDGLTDTEAANLYTIVQNFQTSLNRQV